MRQSRGDNPFSPLNLYLFFCELSKKIVLFRSEELVSCISQLPPSTEVIRTMDEISNTVGPFRISEFAFSRNSSWRNLKRIGFFFFFFWRFALSLMQRNSVGRLILTGNHLVVLLFKRLYFYGSLALLIMYLVKYFFCVYVYFREYVEEATNASMRIYDHLHVSLFIFWVLVLLIFLPFI